MSTLIEDRLTAALQARAELVQLEDLHHQTPRAPERTPVWRRPAVVALVAAVAVAAVVVPIALRSGHGGHQQPMPADHFPLPRQQVEHTLSGDVDGDGRPDRVHVSGHTLTVTLAAHPAHPLTVSEREIDGLAGLAQVGTPGLGILTVEHVGHGDVNWGITALRHGRLRAMAETSSEDVSALAVYPGHLFSWVTRAGVPMSGRLDPLQQGERRLAIAVSRYLPRGGRLAGSVVGRWCWDVVTQRVPAPCPPGVTDAFDPGSHGSLPSLQPRLDINDSIDPLGTWQTGSTSLHMEEDPAPASSQFGQVYDVVGTIDGHDVSARAGVFDPIMFKTFVDLGHGVQGLAVDEQGADPKWNLLAYVDGKLVPLPAPGGAHELHPGVDVVVAHGKGHEATTWIGPNRQVFTSVQTGGSGHDELYQWQVTDASATNLTAVDLGPVCIDDFWDTYGTCPSPR